MSRNFGLTSGTASGVERPSRSHIGAGGKRAELLSFPSGSVLEPLDVPDPPLHKFSVIDRALIGVLAGIALVSAFFILFFVEV